MAQKFGGKYSPEGSQGDAQSATPHPFKGKKPARAQARVNLLFIAPLPLAFIAFFREPIEMAASLLAVGLLLFSAWMTREGVAAHQAYDARTVARRPAMPRKLFGAVLMGAGLATAGFAASAGVVSAVIFGILGAALHIASFGMDPMQDKGTEGIDSFQQDRVARVVEEGERHLKTMTEAIKRTEDRKLIARVEQFKTVARNMFRTVEDDPRDLTAARKYMGVYLMGARDATVKFSEIYNRNHSQKARADYENLLDYLSSNFEARTQKLLENNTGDLDIEIEVLRERLAREGV
ncbi:5-bromo-4-chloroindolyl phosphate hydrolysis family protein [Falsihalocynthiibacter sp. SS001]|uniref:5-bromo-4-chloroindolyl phosphate hydrolysis family protein n=1 Tax=Falsihalocynthiibacter sp. SS001 TaxID=3349698 RepID=UPI0036D25453